MVLRFASIAAVLVLSVPALGITVFSPDDPSLQGNVVASQTVYIFSSILDSSTPEFQIDQKVVRVAGGTLDFYYKVLNPSPQPAYLDGFGLDFPTGDSLQLNSGYVNDGNLAPSAGSIAVIGDVTDVGYSFGPDGALVGPPLPDNGTDWLLVRSNALAFTTGSLGADRGIDDPIIPAMAFAPDASSVPEPTSIALISVGISGLAIKFRCSLFCTRIFNGSTCLSRTLHVAFRNFLAVR